MIIAIAMYLLPTALMYVYHQVRIKRLLNTVVYNWCTALVHASYQQKGGSLSAAMMHVFGGLGG